ncbi:MAG: class I tRNA ligase family protein [Chloroflexota bacterium]|nr:class I tRNA ligase family protein [Chloroflexota bacterium]
MFKEVPTHVDFVAQEREILKWWEESEAFEKRRELNQGNERWSFIDGPITANNPMGTHHAWGRTYKDLFHRYWAMKGYDTRYQNGFDCQGLWVEVEVEKELGFESKRDIEAYGIGPFVNLCKQRALKYAAVQTEQSQRLGYWMDWNDPDFLRWLRDKMEEDPEQVISVQGTRGKVAGTVEQIVGRLGTPELGGSYFTFSDDNNYHIWEALKKCHEQGWIYKGHDVMPWCPRCGTGISQHEIVTEGYQELTHPSITLRFPLRARQNESLLVWTTTPWTLTSNVAAAVGPDLTYVKVRHNDEILYLCKGTLHILDGDYEVLAEMPGRALEDWAYDGPFDELPAVGATLAVAQEQERPYPHRVILWDEVSEEEGTGVVHIAPGCGAEDFELSKEHDLPVLAPLDESGVFINGFDWLTGLNVAEVAEPIFEDLERKGLLYKVEDYTHRYPVCWRCGTELVFRLVDEWFIDMGDQLDKGYEEVTEEEKKRNLRYQIMEVMQNTRWIPSFGFDREMDWLRNMQDWMISKKRYWGLALPIWECPKCGHFTVIGSKEELKERAVEGWEEFEGHSPHRPWIDAVKIRCPKCGTPASRVPDVGNPWLDAGIVAFSTLNYHRDRQYWEKWFPADLISETFLLQFRNWFYSLLAMSTIMERKAPFRNVFSYALLLAEDGRQMHKSWGNAIWFDEAAENMGVDVMRWMFCSHRPEKDLRFGYALADETRRRFLIPLWNVYSFFVTYANIDGWEPGGVTKADPLTHLCLRHGCRRYSLLDRWILSELQVLVQKVTEHLDDYDVYGATAPIEAFIDELSNWYVRRSRRRFWKSEQDADKDAAYRTLYRVLTTLCKVLAPFTPFFVEAMYQNLVRSTDEKAPESVHHNDWPVADESLIDEELARDVELAIRAASLGRSARSQAGLKLRQPLARARVLASESERQRLDRLSAIIMDELNVKRLDFVERAGELVSYETHLLPQLLGPKYGSLFPKMQKAVAGMDAEQLAQRVEAGVPIAIQVEDQSIELLPEEVEVRTHAREGYAVAEERGIIVAVDTRLTPELEREGLARDLVRRIQNMRKRADFNIEDRITTYYQAEGQLAEVMEDPEQAAYIQAETLSLDLVEGPSPPRAYVQSFELEGDRITLGVRRATTGR